jgi:hypothetical protein
MIAQTLRDLLPGNRRELRAGKQEQRLGVNTMHQRRVRVVIVAFAISVFGTLYGLAQTKDDTQAVAVLFGRFETVAFIRSKTLFEKQSNDYKRTDITPYLTLPFGEMLEAIGRLRPHTADVLAKSYASFVMGAKNFGSTNARATSDLGMIDSDDCYIGILEGGAQPDLSVLFQDASTDVIAGLQVWKWSTSSSHANRSSSTFYAAQVGDPYLVLCNNRDDFGAVANALRGGLPLTMPAVSSRPDSDIINPSFWMVRPVSPKNTNRARVGLENVTSDVTSISFFSNLDKRENAIQVRSSNTSADASPSILPPSVPIQLHSVSPGRWRASVPTPTTDAEAGVLLEICGLFGFVVSI